MNVSFQFAWYDLWVGAFWERGRRILYVCPLPCCVILFDFGFRPCVEGEREPLTIWCDAANSRRCEAAIDVPAELQELPEVVDFVRIARWQARPEFADKPNGTWYYTCPACAATEVPQS